MKNYQFNEEYYKCRRCDERVESDNIVVKWKCPDCNELLKVFVKDGNQNIVYIRKNGEDIKIGDLVDIPASSYDFHEVVNNQNSGKVSKIALKNHGVAKLGDGDWLNCILGRWDGNVNEL